MQHPYTNTPSGYTVYQPGNRKERGVTNLQEFDFANSTIIRPPAENFDHYKSEHKKFTTLVIDSRDRDTSQYPTPNEYTVDFEEDFQDVVAVELVTAQLPFKTYIVHEGNNTLDVEIASAIRTITVEPGDYSAGELQVELTRQLSACFQDVGVTFVVDYNLQTDKYTLYASAPFKLILQPDDLNVAGYRSRTLGKVLGFDRKNVQSGFQLPPIYSSEPYYVAAPFRKNFQDANYLVMHVDNLTVNTSINTVMNKSFAIIPQKKDEQNIYTFTHKVRKELSPPIPRLSKLRIRFTNTDGVPHDFQNHDHILQFMVESYKQIRRYNSYLDN